MKIEFYSSFTKNYNKRFGGNRRINDSSNPILKDHILKGKKFGFRAFSITGDIRVIYQLINGTVYFFDIGTHNQVY